MNEIPAVHGAMCYSQKSFKLVWWCYQLLSRFLTKVPLAPGFLLVTNDKGNNEMIPGGCAQISWHLPYSLGKPQLGDCMMKGLYNQSSPQMGSLTSK
jgi:hypothetical protein